MSDTSEGPRPLLVLMPRGRVGSNLLTSQLNAHRQIKMFNEVLTSMGTRHGKRKDEAWIEQRAWLEAFVAGLSEHAKRRYVGLKVDFGMIGDPDAFIGFVCDHGFTTLYIHRANFVKQAVSLVRARANAARTREKYGAALWGIGSPEDALPPGPVDPVEIEQIAGVMMRQHEACVSGLERAGIDYLPIEYASFTRDMNGTLVRIEAFLGIDGITRDTRFVKGTDDDLRLAVTNFDALQARLTHEPFASMLVEGVG